MIGGLPNLSSESPSKAPNRAEKTLRTRSFERGAAEMWLAPDFPVGGVIGATGRRFGGRRMSGRLHVQFEQANLECQRFLDVGGQLALKLFHHL